MYTYFVKSVDRIVDGDTIDISIDLGFDLTKKERVRLAGIDTPEKRTKNEKEKEMGYQATEFLEMHLMVVMQLLTHGLKYPMTQKSLMLVVLQMCQIVDLNLQLQRQEYIFLVHPIE